LEVNLKLKMFKSQKNVFWQAFLLALFIFLVGIFLGFILENSRINEINNLYKISEINLLDVNLQNEIYSLKDFNCEFAIEENLNFADRIYNEAKILERYEKAGKLKEEMSIQHKKYDLLRAVLILNSIKLKERCNHSPNVLIYFYKYNDVLMNLKAKQSIFSKKISQLKEEFGKELLIIPLSGDNNLSSINLFLDKYNVSVNELPVIIINEKTKITELEDLNELEKYFN